MCEEIVSNKDMILQTETQRLYIPSFTKEPSKKEMALKEKF